MGEAKKTPSRIQIVPPPAPSGDLGPAKSESLPWRYAVLLFLSFVFAVASLYLSFAA